MNKLEELEKAVLMLEERVEANKTMNTGYENDLVKAKKQLADINKPELTPMQFDLIQEAIEEGVGNFDFSNTDKYDKEFGLDYDGRVMLDSLELNDTYELIEGIVERVHKLFTEAECPEDTPEKVKYDDELNKE